MSTTEQDIATVQDALRTLSPDGVKTLAFLAGRLMGGQRAYGHLDLKSDPRDFVKERNEEVADLLVYSAFEALKRTL